MIQGSQAGTESFQGLGISIPEKADLERRLAFGEILPADAIPLAESVDRLQVPFRADLGGVLLTDAILGIAQVEKIGSNVTANKIRAGKETLFDHP